MQEVNDNHILWDEQIDKFLRNQMTAEEENAFLAEMESDKKMKSYVTTTTLLIDGIRKQAAQADDVVINAAKAATEEEIYAAADRQMPTGKKLGKVIRMNRWMSCVAAIAAMFICVFILNKSLVSNGTMNSIAGISATESQMRGVENDVLCATLTRIYNNVDSGQYMASNIVQLEEMYQKTTDDITDDEDDYKYDIGLYLVKAYVINGQKEDAKRILTELYKTYPKDQKISDLQHQLTKKFFWE